MDERTRNLIVECKRLEESCLYSSTTLFEWLKVLRFWKAVFVVVPIVFGSIATWQLLAQRPDLVWLTAICSLLAGIAPAVYKALDLDVSLDTIAKHAGVAKVQQDRYRQCWRVTAHGPFDEFKKDFDVVAAAFLRRARRTGPRCSMADHVARTIKEASSTGCLPPKKK